MITIMKFSTGKKKVKQAYVYETQIDSYTVKAYEDDGLYSVEVFEGANLKYSFFPFFSLEEVKSQVPSRIESLR
jgi:hypothetical protein